MLKAGVASTVACSLIVVAGCSEVSGVNLVVVGGLPQNFGSTLHAAAIASGFVEAGYPAPSEGSNAYYFERVSERGALPLRVEARQYEGRYHLYVGRSIYAGYSATETEATVSLIAALRTSGLVLAKVWVREMNLPKDMDRWLASNRGHGT